MDVDAGACDHRSSTATVICPYSLRSARVGFSKRTSRSAPVRVQVDSVRRDMRSVLDTARSRPGYYGVLGCVYTVFYRESYEVETTLWGLNSIYVGARRRRRCWIGTSPPSCFAAGPARLIASPAHVASCLYPYIGVS